jgi:type II secretory pathway pseudopilin PulG
MKSQSGITLIEMILYIGIVALISSSLVGLYIQIINLRSSATAIQEVNESIRLASTKLAYEIRQAHPILGVGSSLRLDMVDTSRNPTIFDLNSSRIRMTVGTSIAYITSNLVNIDTLTFTNLSSGDSLAQNIRYTIDGHYLGHNASITNSVEIRSK